MHSRPNSPKRPNGPTFFEKISLFIVDDKNAPQTFVLSFVKNEKAHPLTLYSNGKKHLSDIPFLKNRTLRAMVVPCGRHRLAAIDNVNSKEQR